MLFLMYFHSHTGRGSVSFAPVVPDTTEKRALSLGYGFTIPALTFMHLGYAFLVFSLEVLAFTALSEERFLFLAVESIPCLVLAADGMGLFFFLEASVLLPIKFVVFLRLFA